jgi:hypothetical protein
MGSYIHPQPQVLINFKVEIYDIWEIQTNFAWNPEERISVDKLCVHGKETLKWILYRGQYDTNWIHLAQNMKQALVKEKKEKTFHNPNIAKLLPAIITSYILCIMLHYVTYSKPTIMHWIEYNHLTCIEITTA